MIRISQIPKLRPAVVHSIESRLEILSDSGFETLKAFLTLIVFPGVFNICPLLSQRGHQDPMMVKGFMINRGQS